MYTENLMSGGTMARIGLRMMPPFPSSPLRCRTAGFPSVRLVWGFLCQGGVTPFWSSFFHLPFFCSTRAAGILPSRPHIAVAVARSEGQGRRLYGAFAVKGTSNRFLSCCCFILLFDPRREHSSAPTTCCHRRCAQRWSRTALLQRRRRLVLDDREHGGNLPVIGWFAKRSEGSLPLATSKRP